MDQPHKSYQSTPQNTGKNSGGPALPSQLPTYATKQDAPDDPPPQKSFLKSMCCRSCHMVSHLLRVGDRIVVLSEGLMLVAGTRHAPLYKFSFLLREPGTGYLLSWFLHAAGESLMQLYSLRVPGCLHMGSCIRLDLCLPLRLPYNGGREVCAPGEECRCVKTGRDIHPIPPRCDGSGAAAHMLRDVTKIT